jgi:hypothetical protein
VEVNEGEELNEGEGDTTSAESAPKSLTRRGRLATTVVALNPNISPNTCKL